MPKSNSKSKPLLRFCSSLAAIELHSNPPGHWVITRHYSTHRPPGLLSGLSAVEAQRSTTTEGPIYPSEQTMEAQGNGWKW